MQIKQNKLTSITRPDGVYILRQQKRMTNRCRKIFKKQLDWIVRNLKGQSFLGSENNFYSKNALEDDINLFADDIPYQKDLAENIVLIMTPAVQRGAKQVIKKHKLGKFGISFTLENVEARQFLGDRLALELSPYKGTIHHTTKKRIADILLEASKKGLAYTEIAKLIQQQGKAGVFSKKRGETIAVREIGQAYEKGNDIPIQDFMIKYPDRVVKKRWWTANDDRVTPECHANQEQGWLDYREEFLSGDLRAPRATNVGCRCATLERILPAS